MRKFMINRLHPHPLALVDAPTFPILRMDQMYAPVFKSTACRFAPIDIFVPFDAWLAEMIIAAEFRNCAAKGCRTASLEKIHEITIHLAAPLDGWQEHSQ